MINSNALMWPVLTKIAISKYFGNQIKHYAFDADGSVVLIMSDDSQVPMREITQQSDIDFIHAYMHDADFLWTKVRILRDQKLKNSDWSVMPDAKTDKNAWKNYRQLLRNIPQQYSDPAQVQFPEPPTQ